MPKYLMLSTLSEQGLQTLRANPDRLREVNKDVEEIGAKVLHQWFVLGPYDFVNIVEAESAAVIAEVSISLGARGSVHTQSYEMLEVDDLMKLLGA
ncbi:MAG: GYD domain-containing protein [Gaiellaceae bacterium]